MPIQQRKEDDIPKSRVMGRPDHQPNKTSSGIQKSVNWILRSIERTSAILVGGFGLPKKYLRERRRK